MATKERPADRGTERARLIRSRLGGEIRQARVGLGLSLDDVGRAVRLSGGQISRIERGLVPRVSVFDLARLHAVVGLELAAKSYPGGPPIRDVAHAQLLADLRARLHGSLRWAVEVPLPLPTDLRAWDGAIRGVGFLYGVEAETSPHDGQALLRRLQAKLRDSDADGAILLLRGTLQTRRFLAEAAGWLGTTFPVSGPRALELLGAGVDPGGSAIVVLPKRRMPRP